MPLFVSVVNVDAKTGTLLVTGRVEIQTQFYGGFSGKPRDENEERLAQTLAARIEEAVTAAIKDFDMEFAPNGSVRHIVANRHSLES